ncbi:hypothetical protein BFW01_g4227 [Lasiodiplodia theobromae]|uniref:4-hydroxy-2-oxo-heptane-1,7-dioate aldolase n=1 Tax=Lasiodiplodia theobromae TaxID=45133 RepID=A0A5N5D9P6_9PEZI|nr:uncharacterized protein LTHEOB_11757 [Lasiodiplodia theobromae]KAB2574439.1 4-hydroxy-2-oxo-heptane-1,7-dioate aldolase [Lasiodiplodia theobromae]KAF4536889.1 hypothetical protein LTHEOB_11757 [Lasiodiplodia theobromae]KAF9633333.1 hypothetical protein BFW01_g4227 [Lasiodiplodia theobromae]
MPGTKTTAAVSRGPTRLQLSLQHAAADREGGSPSVGQWIQFRNSELAESVAGSGSDFVIIDCERSHINTPADLSLVVEAVVAAGSSPIVRVLASQPKRIRWAQDSGAHGVMVAMCETKAQAERIVVATGCPSPRFVVIVEIDSQKAVENVDGIASIAGIDALFVGAHLSSSPDSDAVLAAAHRHAKFPGHFAADADTAVALVRRGWQFVNCGGADLQAIEELERMRRTLVGMRASPPPIEGDEYEWDGKDWG